MKTGINIKIGLMVFSIILVVISFLSWFFTKHEEKALNTELEERIRSLVDNLADNSEYGILTLNKDEVTKLANNTLRRKDIVHVRIEDKESALIVEVGKKEGKTQLKEFSAPILTTRKGETETADEELVLGVGEKLKEEKIGEVKLVVSLEPLYRKTREAKRVVMILAFIVIVITIILISLGVKVFITFPIGILISATQEIAGGNLDYRAKVKSEDEMGALATFFNKMTKELKQSREKIEEYNRTLEQKVEERTRELRESQERLAQSSKMAAVGQLAGGVAHEINNPIGVILGFAQSIAKRISENDQLYMPLKSIEREAIRCKKLVGDLLTFSRSEKTRREITDINETIDETLSLIEAQARVKNVELIKEYGGDLPRTTVNKSQIQQVIINLCNNAIDAMPEGGRVIIATRSVVARNGIPGLSLEGVRSQSNLVAGSEQVPQSDNEIATARQEGTRRNDMVEISITDTGKGMTEEVKKHIFEPFFTTKEVGKGTGLGLSLCYEIIQKHNGTIEVESPPKAGGKGTTIRIKLPAN